MAHWERRSEDAWRDFRFNQPYAKGVDRLREEVLKKTNYDPAVLWQWGNMQAMAVIGILKECERAFGERGQQLVKEVLRGVGLDIGRQILEGVIKSENMSEAEFASFYATVINRIVYASLEEPTIDSDDEVSFHILWCPHQDYYGAFDCRVQRYLVQGMIEALQEKEPTAGWQVRFTQTIPAGAETCRFVLWRASDDERTQWELYSEQLERKALEIAERQNHGGD